MKGVKRHYRRRAESRSASLRKWLLGGDLWVNGSWPGRLGREDGLENLCSVNDHGAERMMTESARQEPQHTGLHTPCQRFDFI